MHGYAQHGQPQPPQSIRILGILNVVFAGLGVLGLLFAYGMYFGGLKLGPRNPVVEIAHATPAFMRYLEISLWVGAVALVVLAISGIGLLGTKPWGRKLAIIYAVYGIVGGIVGLVVTYHYLIGPLSGKPGGSAGAFGGVWGGIIGCAYPIVLLSFMLKRNVREWFARVALPEARVHH
jgi:hypothetical protein